MSIGNSSKFAQLLAQHRDIERQIVELAHTMGAVDANRSSTKRRGRPPGRRNGRGASEEVKALVKLLQGAGSAMSRREIACQLGVAASAVSVRVTQAIRYGFVERVAHGRYACATTVPPL